jgi:very-short-patch-repair endonuclease
MDCANCGNCFRIVPSAPANGRRFCSRSCYRKFTGETMLEFRVRQALAALGISFVQELQVKNWTIDFALTEAWIALEADGEYWHQLRPESDAIKDRALRQMGWHVVRLAESDVNNAADLCELVLGRLQEVPGLELSRLPPASGGPERMIVRRSDRRPFRLKHRDAARVKPTTGITDGTLPLWGEDEITGPQGFDQDIA